MHQDENNTRLDEKQYRMIVESAPNMIWRAGTDALCDYFNSTWLNYTGQPLKHELGNGWVEGVHPEDVGRCFTTYMEAFNKHEIFEMLYRLKRYDGEYRWIHDKGTPFFDDAGGFCGYIGSCLDVNEQITGESWKAMAQNDGLTGVLNRSFFDQEANKLYASAIPQATKLLALMLDIDNFKYFNDQYGHHFGDKILIAFSGVLKESIRKSDLLSRYGGDEFLLILPETDLTEVMQVIFRIKEKLKQALNTAEYSGVTVSFSFGIAEACENETYESFIERADHAMYEEKRRKKATLCPEQEEPVDPRETNRFNG